MDGNYSFRNKLLAGLFISSILCLICLGDTAEQLLQAKSQIDTLIESRNYTAAEAAIAQLKVEYAGHLDLSWRLHEISCIYAKVGEMSRYRSMCEQIATDFPQSAGGKIAQLYLARVAVEALIDQEDYAGAEAAIAQMKSTFAAHPDLSWRLQEISCKYAEANKMERYRSMCQQIAVDFPKSVAGRTAQLYLSKISVEEFIEREDYTAADAKIAQIQSAFVAHPDLPLRLHEIGHAYAHAGHVDKFVQIAEFTKTQYPSSVQSLQSECAAEGYLIKQQIEAGDLSAAQSRIATFMSHAKENPYLPEALYTAAAAYANTKGYPEAEGLYRQIIEGYPNSEQAERSVVAKAILPILQGMDDNKDVGPAIAGFKQEFASSRFLGGTLMFLMEKYCRVANQSAMDGLMEQTTENYEKAVQLWEDTVKEYPNSAMMPDFYYYAGDAYYELGRYEESVHCFQTAINKYPVYRYHWHGLYQIGQCYERMWELKAVSEAEAKTAIGTAYEQILQKYPNCDVAKQAQEWLTEGLIH